MTHNPVPQQILVLSARSSSVDDDLETRRVPGLPSAPSPQPVELTALQSQVTIFLQQIQVIMQDAPEAIGDFKLSEFEISAGIVVEAKGKVNLALIANAEAGGEINAAIRFTFKR